MTVWCLNHAYHTHPFQIDSWDMDLDTLRRDPQAMIVDVREASEFARGNIEGSVNWPLSTLRQSIPDLPKMVNKKLYVYCQVRQTNNTRTHPEWSQLPPPTEPFVHAWPQVGMRGYLATRQLLLAGIDAVNIAGGFRSWQTQFKPLQSKSSKL